jgi:hypothetical protein
LVQVKNGLPLSSGFSRKNTAQSRERLNIAVRFRFCSVQRGIFYEKDVARGGVSIPPRRKTSFSFIIYK